VHHLEVFDDFYVAEGMQGKKLIIVQPGGRRRKGRDTGITTYKGRPTKMLVREPGAFPIIALPSVPNGRSKGVGFETSLGYT
jgi:hypothetical protein